MKKKLTITLGIIVLMLTTFAGGVYAHSQYIEWQGSDDYRQTLINLDLISDRGDQLKTDKQNLITERDNLQDEYDQLITEHENTHRENEQLTNVIKDKENQINSLEQQIEALEKRIADGQTAQDMLEQAEVDMNHVEEKSKEVLEGLSDE